LATAPTCDTGGFCVPDGYCISSNSVTECPAGYDLAQGIYAVSELSDTRDCTCSCTQDAPGNCTYRLELFEAADCTGTQYTSVDEGGCESSLNGPFASARYNPVTTANCMLDAETPSGGLVPAVNRTVCCRP
jgi:hypothetical protein